LARKMATASKDVAGRIGVAISPDKLEAFLVFRPGARISPPTSLEVMGLLRERCISIDREAMIRVRDALSECRKGRMARGGVLLARGTPPTESTDQQIHWEVQPEQGSQESPLPIRRVKAGQAFGRITPAETGEPGLDVHGHPLPARRPEVLRLELGEDVRMDDQQVLHAKSEGVVLSNSYSLSIVPLVEIDAGSIDSDKRIEMPGVLLVHGSVPEGAFLQAGAGIFIDGQLAGGMIYSGGHLVCTGGIEAKKAKARLAVCGDLWCPHLFEAQLNVQGNLIVTNEMHGVDACVVGEVRAAEAPFSLGHITCSGNARLGILGSPRGDETHLSVGIHHSLKKEFDRLNSVFLKAGRASTIVERACFLSSVRKSDAATREKVCQWEMAKFELDRMQTSVKERMTAISETMLQFGETGISIQEFLYPGCKLAVGDVRGVINAGWTGPLLVSAKRISNVDVLVIQSESGRKMVIR